MIKVNDIIEISRPSLGYLEEEAVRETMASGWVGQGEKVLAFEEACRQLIGCKHFVAVSSCTSAIELSLISSGCQRGDQVMIPSLTYASVVHVLLNLGLVPIFIDIDPNNLNICINDIIQKMNPAVKFIIPVHFRGKICNLEAINNVAGSMHIKVIEDAAHAFGSTRNKQHSGKHSYAACFSFGPLKNITCMEGGGIATNSSELAAALINYRNLGSRLSTWQRFAPDKIDMHTLEEPFIVDGPGGKCQMSDIAASVGLAQLSRMQEIRSKRNKIANRYRLELQDISKISFPDFDTDEDFLYICVVTVEEDKREALMAHLKLDGIRTTIHYKPNHLQPYFAPYCIGSLPHTEAVASCMLTLPSYTDLTTDQQSHVIDSFRRFYNANN
jgi:dTDP-4-amino-4,6-dideoxygalactose transaminase